MLSDFHRGKHSGSWGSLLIDISSICLLALSLSGLALWISLRKRRRLGLASMALSMGFCICAGLYCLL